MGAQGRFIPRDFQCPKGCRSTSNRTITAALGINIALTGYQRASKFYLRRHLW